MTQDTPLNVTCAHACPLSSRHFSNTSALQKVSAAELEVGCGKKACGEGDLAKGGHCCEREEPSQPRRRREDMSGHRVMSWPSMTWNFGVVLLLLLLLLPPATGLESFAKNIFSMSSMRGPDDRSARTDMDMPPTGEKSALSC
jgi:hypothetical protein